ncbi:hypothetical protein PYR71_27460 [Rhizobium sp. MC63]|uniref:Uncharacterized protein n=1 Tax=Rhizobium mulingense TaxID=3031128 RepID=A0ACC6N5J2_9HYPH|nr:MULTISPECIES: hypothetical protein [unclassified Rhizobium]MDF0700161.1 hypothetical protein [Rhizobium sp. MC63]MEA3520859.1 hypothetical protein [Rhizobium sp. MJ31]MEB3047706.1 hypothetical protein [Rhizobium sp. MJ21]
MLRSVISLVSMLLLSIPSISAERALAQDNPNVQLIAFGDPAMAKAHEKSIGSWTAFSRNFATHRREPKPTASSLVSRTRIKGVELTTDQMAPDVEFIWVYQIEASSDHFPALLAIGRNTSTTPSKGIASRSGRRIFSTGSMSRKGK